VPPKRAGKPRWTGPADTPISVAAAAILENLRLALLREQAGIERGTDAQCLHRYRVALRRTRTLLAQLRRQLPRQRVKQLRGDLVWLAELTTRVRDMDVYMHEWPAYRRVLPPARRADLQPLYAYLVTRREHLRRILLRGLRSGRYRRVLLRWQALEAEIGASGDGKTVRRVAAKRVARLISRVKKRARRIHAQAPPQRLHKLRKDCKRLRYMLEFFGDSVAQLESSRLIADLKTLQDALGTIHDLYVHHAALREFRATLAPQVSPRQLAAMDGLLDHLQQQRRGHYATLAPQLAAFVKLLS
jgi:CHAD domain-containing protein